MMISDYRFTINAYLRLIECCGKSEKSKKCYYEKKILELIENMNDQENCEYIPDFLKTNCHLMCENILKNSEKCDYRDMTISEFIEFYPELKAFKNSEIGVSLSKCGIHCRVVKRDKKTKRIRKLPIPIQEIDSQP